MQNVVELKLTDIWLGHPKDSIVRVGTRQANQMMERKIAVIHKGGNGNGNQKEKTTNETKASNPEQEKEVVGKLQKRVNDKMIKTSINK